jgi:PhnB protein
MKKLTPYLSFDGQCEAALNFYRDCLNGEIKSLQRYGEAPEMQAPDERKNHVLHADFAADGLSFMAADSYMPPTSGGQVTLCLELTEADAPDELWAKLTDGGTVTNPLAMAFWGARFGEFTDKFGIQWMMIVEKAEEAA